MTLKVRATYLSIILVLVTTGYLLGFHYWWVDMDPQFLVFIACGIVWFGAIYFGFFIARLTSFRDLGNNYIGLIELTGTNFLKDLLGINKANRLRTFCTISSFSFFFLLVAIFHIHTKQYSAYQLYRYGIHKKIVVEEISFSNGRRISFEFYYNQKIYHKDLHSEKYEIGDTASITFSSFNPNIVGLDNKTETTH